MLKTSDGYELVRIPTRCRDCLHVLIEPMEGILSCGHPSLSVNKRWVTAEDEVEPFLPVEEDGFCSKGERCS